MARKYSIAYREYIGYEDQLSYLKEAMGEPLLLTKARLKTFMQRTGLQVKQAFPTPDPDVLMLRLTNNPILHTNVLERMEQSLAIPNHYVTTRRWDGRAERKFGSIIQHVFSPFVKRDIEASVPHGSYSELPELAGSAFKILIWSTPNEMAGRYRTPPSELWDIPVSCRSEAYEPTDKGLTIMDGDYCVAELFEHALYIHHDLVHEGDGYEQQIMVELLKRAGALYKATNWKNINREREKRRLEREEKSLVEFAQRASSRAASRNKDELTRMEQEIRELRKQVFSKEREMATLRLNDTGVNLEEQVIQEFRKLKEGFANIQDARFDGNALVVITSPINSISKNNGCHYHLGRVRIKIPFDQAGNIYMTDPDEGRRIPHTGDRESGHACLGNVLDEVSSYMANYEMLAAVSIMLAFLERGINTNDDWGQYLKNFPNLGVPE